LALAAHGGVVHALGMERTEEPDWPNGFPPAAKAMVPRITYTELSWYTRPDTNGAVWDVNDTPLLPEYRMVPERVVTVVVT